MASIRRKSRTPFPFVLVRHRALPEGEQPRFTIVPPTERAWARLIDEGVGPESILAEAVILFVEKLENDPDGAAFGAAGSKERVAFVDESLGADVIRELGNAVADTMLAESDRKN
jgi:hypothetical protein